MPSQSMKDACAYSLAFQLQKMNNAVAEQRRLVAKLWVKNNRNPSPIVFTELQKQYGKLESALTNRRLFETI